MWARGIGCKAQARPSYLPLMFDCTAFSAMKVAIALRATLLNFEKLDCGFDRIVG